MRLRFLAAILLGLAACPAPAAADDIWSMLRNGDAIALMRHAEAPGTGDPPGFRLEDCATQRNLSAAGRAQAAQIGAQLRAQGLASAAVFTSAWCRCRDTAMALGLGRPDIAPPLNSFFGDGDPGGRQTTALRRLIDGLPRGQATILVTHQVNITALTGVYPASGEVIVVARQNLAVLRRLKMSDS